MQHGESRKPFTASDDHLNHFLELVPAQAHFLDAPGKDQIDLLRVKHRASIHFAMRKENLACSKYNLHATADKAEMKLALIPHCPQNFLVSCLKELVSYSILGDLFRIR